jgi:hypothetical protein
MLKISRGVLQTQKASPTILFGAGVVGVVASTVLACKATLKLESVLNGAEDTLNVIAELENEKYSDNDRRRDKAIVRTKTAVKVLKLYGPAITVGTIGVTCLAGSHKILTTRNAGLMAAYATLEKGFEEYRSRVLGELGEEKERELRYGHELQTVKDEFGEKVVKRVAAGEPSIYARFFDEVSPSWKKTPEYNFLFVRCQQNWANDMLKARGHVFLNEVYDSLGISRTKAGAVVGWVLHPDNDNFIDFGVFDGNNERARDFVNGREGSILLDFNVDGVILDQI